MDLAETLSECILREKVELFVLFLEFVAFIYPYFAGSLSQKLGINIFLSELKHICCG